MGTQVYTLRQQVLLPGAYLIQKRVEDPLSFEGICVLIQHGELLAGRRSMQDVHITFHRKRPPRRIRACPLLLRHSCSARENNGEFFCLKRLLTTSATDRHVPQSHTAEHRRRVKGRLHNGLDKRSSLAREHV